MQGSDYEERRINPIKEERLNAQQATLKDLVISWTAHKVENRFKFHVITDSANLNQIDLVFSQIELREPSKQFSL